MLKVPDHTPDCYVRPGEYLHHLYIDGVKYVVAPAVLDCLAQAEDRERQRGHPPPAACTRPTTTRCSPTPQRRRQPRRA